MHLTVRVQYLIDQLCALVDRLGDEQYSMPVAQMGGASIGQHLRHIVEFHQELLKGYHDGQVFYHKRKRDLRLETNREFALATMVGLADKLRKDEKELLVFDDGDANGDTLGFSSSYSRELIYNIDHTVHHMALIRIAVGMVSDLELPSEFGVASSTLRFRKGMAEK